MKARFHVESALSGDADAGSRFFAFAFTFAFVAFVACRRRAKPSCYQAFAAPRGRQCPATQRPVAVYCRSALEIPERERGAEIKNLTSPASSTRGSVEESRGERGRYRDAPWRGRRLRRAKSTHQSGQPTMDKNGSKVGVVPQPRRRLPPFSPSAIRVPWQGFFCSTSSLSD